MSRLPRVSAKVADALIALAVAAFGAGGALAARHHDGHAAAAAAAIQVAMGLILYPRRRFPGSVLAAMAGLVAGLAAVRASLGGAFIPVLISSYSAAVYGGRRLASALSAGAVLVLIGLGIPSALGATSLRSEAAVPVVLAACGACLVGFVIRGQFAARAAHLEVLAERAELAAARRQDEARQATIAERLRIARELHDIVAHHLSVVVIQAQGAQRIIGRDSDRALAAMSQVEQTGRTALEEMRSLLGLLRSGEPPEDLDEPPDGPPGVSQARMPRPGLADISAMAIQLRAAGLPVTVHTVGEPGHIREDVSLTGYRIVQEALTNVVKHAGPAAATVTLTFGDTLDIEVTDDGRGAAAGLAAGLPGAGHGMAGMRERVAMLNGKLAAGPRPGGGYRVHAVIPLEEP
jgi:signal transduction histidine kinase